MAPRHEQLVRDQACVEQPLELGVGAAELVQRLAVHAVRFLAADEEELTAEQEAGPGLPDRIVDQLVGRLQVIGCVVPAHANLGGAELEQQAGPLLRGGRLCQRTPQVGNRVLGSAACAGAAGGLAEGRNSARVGSGSTVQQVCSDELGLRACLRQQLRRPGVPAVTLERCERLVDRAAEQRMDEAERPVGLQNVHARERLRSLECGRVVQAGQRDCESRFDVVAEDGDRPGERRRLGRKVGEAKSDGP